MNKPANDDSISRVFPKKTNLCFLEALGSLMFLLGRGRQRLGQPIEKPISPRPSGTGMPALKLKRRPIFKAPLRGASTDGANADSDEIRLRVQGAEIVDDYFSRAKELTATEVTALDNLKYAMVGARSVVSGHDGLVNLRVERPAQAFFRLDPVATQQLIKLLQGNLNALVELLNGAGSLSSKSPFQVVDYR
jgi:hypothetical protein